MDNNESLFTGANGANEERDRSVADHENGGAEENTETEVTTLEAEDAQQVRRLTVSKALARLIICATFRMFLKT